MTIGNMYNNVVKIARVGVWFRRYPRGQTDRQTHAQRRTHHNTSQPLPRAK